MPRTGLRRVAVPPPGKTREHPSNPLPALGPPPRPMDWRRRPRSTASARSLRDGVRIVSDPAELGYHEAETAACDRTLSKPMSRLVNSDMIGQPVLRREDRRFLVGHGRYVSDVPIGPALSLGVVRSPHAHATIVRIDVEAARRLPGVIGAFSLTDLPELRGALPPPVVPAVFVKPYRQSALADGLVRFAGEPVVAVVATDPYRATDAAAVVRVEYEPLAGGHRSGAGGGRSGGPCARRLGHQRRRDRDHRDGRSRRGARWRASGRPPAHPVRSAHRAADGAAGRGRPLGCGDRELARLVEHADALRCPAAHRRGARASGRGRARDGSRRRRRVSGPRDRCTRKS